MNKYIFILGQATDLAKQEIINILGIDNIETMNSNFVIAKTDYNSQELMSILGGTIKIAKYLEELISLEKLSITKWKSYLSLQPDTKNYFGFSLYNFPPADYQRITKLALSLKKELKQRYKIRLVTSKEPILSSVIVAKEHLLNSELIIIKTNKIILGLTETVQDFVKYGTRDMKRPERDTESGLLPPKVAQMMINLAGAKRDRVILDPFCGSGTIIQEAMLLNFKTIYASDLSDKAVNDTLTNTNWLKETFSLHNQVIIKKADVKSLSKQYPAQSIDLIVTEPFMGDARFIQKQRNIKALQNTIKELKELYYLAFTEFKKILKPNGIIVFIFPIFNIADDYVYTLNPNIISQLGYNLKLPAITSNHLSENQNIIYSRPQQKVLREISIWQNK